MDLDLQLVRAFVEVVDCSHFGLAAERLHVSQSVVTRRVQRLESELGVELLARTSRSLALTDAGVRFLPLGRRLLDDAEEASAAARGARVLRVGYAGGVSLRGALRVLREGGRPGAVRLREIAWFEQADALLAHRVDVLVGRLPFPPEGVVVEPLHLEDRVVLVPCTHPLAGRASVSIDDLAGEPMLRHPGVLGAAWDSYWALDPRPDGAPVAWGPVVHGIEDKLEFVARGDGLAVVPGSVADVDDDADVVAVPLHDAPPAEVVVAWPDRTPDPGLREEFVAAVRKVLGDGELRPPAGRAPARPGA